MKQIIEIGTKNHIFRVGKKGVESITWDIDPNCDDSEYEADCYYLVKFNDNSEVKLYKSKVEYERTIPENN